MKNLFFLLNGNKRMRDRNMISETGLALVIIILISGMNLSLCQDKANCLAVITEVKGEVMIKRFSGSGFNQAYWGTQLFRGDNVKTSAGSDAVITMSNNSIIKLGPGSEITISGTDPGTTSIKGNVKTISSGIMVNLSALTTKRENRKDAGALAGLRFAEVSEIIEPLTPCNTFIKTSRPSFSWLAKETFDNYKVSLYNSRGLVWSKKVSQGTMKYPENEKDLEFGESYFWNVTGEGLIDNKKSVNNKFTILSKDKTREIEEQEKLILDTFKDESESSGMHSLLGTFYINQGLLQDAIEEFKLISEMYPDAPLPHEILGSLYSDAGSKDKAIEELQKALALAKDNKD